MWQMYFFGLRLFNVIKMIRNPIFFEFKASCIFFITWTSNSWTLSKQKNDKSETFFFENEKVLVNKKLGNSQRAWPPFTNSPRSDVIQWMAIHTNDVTNFYLKQIFLTLFLTNDSWTSKKIKFSMLKRNKHEDFWDTYYLKCLSFSI